MVGRHVFQLYLILALDVFVKGGSSLNYPNCTGIDQRPDHIGDSLCDSENNNEDCGWDGGDCCECTCMGDSCLSESSRGFDCLDPDAAREVDGCLEWPSVSSLAPSSCDTINMSKYIVENTMEARYLAEFLHNCTGVAMEVTWKGHVVIEKAFSVAGRTSLNVTGVGSNASMDGGGTTGLFVISNASLIVSNMALVNGNSTSGGAIAAQGSKLSINDTAFDGNVAGFDGGALFVAGGCTLACSGETSFLNNKAARRGGAISVRGQSHAVWTARTNFSRNSAWYGGAIDISFSSNASWAAGSGVTFSNNSARHSGGALNVDFDSRVIWEEESTFEKNKASLGGGLYVSNGSVVMWTMNTSFSGNYVDSYGGALYGKGRSVLSWTGEVIFSTNVAGLGGGAVYAAATTTASWKASTTFLENSGGKGGGVSLIGASIGSWMGDTKFENNSAMGLVDGSGGALYLERNSTSNLEGKTTFMENTAAIDGGALHVTGYSKALCKGDATFTHNKASGVGGAVSVINGSIVSLSANTSFFANSAEAGGALIAADGSRVEWSGEISFMSNRARLDGGAIGAHFLSSSEELSTIEIDGRSTFENNTCGSNGGALVLSDSLSISGNLTEVTFRGNSAGVYGGAIYISSTRVGPVFKGTQFESNRAQSGGGVYAVLSGTAVSTDPVRGGEAIYRTMFENCEFVNNEAYATGGAVSSASGQDNFVRSSFINNTARFGGALHLAGTASVTSCFFEGNIADFEAGPAISNIGHIVDVIDTSFIDNVFNCMVGSFLDFRKGKPEEIHEVVCDGCPEDCKDCEFGQTPVPKCFVLLSAGIRHAHSDGGATTIEALNIDKGYWRATANSKTILECFNNDACEGGLTGAAGYCRRGYEGPYCSVCSSDYAASLNHVCTPCIARTWGFFVVGVVGILCLLVATMMLLYMVSANPTGRGVVDRVAHCFPFQSTKTVIVVWQIVTQFASVANVTLPRIYQRFLSAVDVLNFDLTWIPSTVCVLNFDFHERLLIATIGPIVCMALLGITYVIATLRSCRSDSALQYIRCKHVSAVLLITFLVYSSVSSMIFKTFACDALDDGKIYLRADYRIECDSAAHKRLQIYAGAMIWLYPVGIPLLYAGLLFKDRNVLGKTAVREVSVKAKPTSDLWKPYTPQRFYYEVVECLRRVSLAGAIIFIYPNTTSQIEVTLVLAFAFTLASEWLAPYSGGWNCWISRIGHVIVCTNMYIALMFDVDGSGKLANSKRLFEMSLVVANVGMVFVVLVEATSMICSMITYEQDGPRPRAMNICYRSFRRFRKEKVYGVATFHGVEARVCA